MTLSYDFQKIMRENWKYWLSAGNQKSPNLQQQFQQILEILRKKLWFRWKKNYGNFERVQAVTRGTSWGLCELQDYKKNFQKFQLQFWEKVCFGGAMILENFKELWILCGNFWKMWTMTKSVCWGDAAAANSNSMEGTWFVTLSPHRTRREQIRDFREKLPLLLKNHSIFK